MFALFILPAFFRFFLDESCRHGTRLKGRLDVPLRFPPLPPKGSVVKRTPWIPKPNGGKLPAQKFAILNPR